MHRRWTPLFVWAAMLAVLTAIVFIFSTNPYYWALHGGAAVATAALAGYYIWRPLGSAAAVAGSASSSASSARRLTRDSARRAAR